MGDVIKIRKEIFVSPTNTTYKEVLDDFGISRETKTVDIDLDIPNDFEVLYITGESGSGKSLILNTAFTETKINEVEFESTQLIKLGKSVDDTLRVLNMLGIGDASLITLYPRQLSDSQRSRARIAKMVIDGNKEIVLDEFLSTLDRATAKSVAYNTQKVMRLLGIRLVVATAHSDLTNYLKPNVVVIGRAFPSEFEVKIYNKSEFSDNPIIDDIVIKVVDKGAYRDERLGEIHYKGKYSGGRQEYFFAYLKDEVVGLLVTNNLISSETRRISRVVVHPTYRGVGIAQVLIKECLKRSDVKIDTLAAMAKYNPVFERAGMTRVEDVKVSPPAGLKRGLKEKRFNFDLWGSIDECEVFCSDVSNREFLSKFSKYANKLIQPGGRKVSDEERSQIIKEDARTAGRILWSFRERTMAKYEAKGGTRVIDERGQYICKEGKS